MRLFQKPECSLNTGDLNMHEIIVKTSIQAEIDQYGRCDESIKQETKIKNYSKKISKLLSKIYLMIAY